MSTVTGAYPISVGQLAALLLQNPAFLAEIQGAAASNLENLPPQSAGYPAGGFWISTNGNPQMAPVGSMRISTTGNLLAVLLAADII